ncbi:MAG: Crp/Fnr family transcriptional regulator [Chitinophagales bacterium]|jgi:CRP/FNR family transcriptional regulator|nr:Crp/Fnr family transcriptional regulator [Chitinophagales bacterium]
MNEIPNVVFSQPLKQEIFNIGIQKEFAKDTIIQDINHNVRGFPLMLSGLVKVFRIDEHGKEILLYYLQPGESCVLCFITCLKKEKSRIKAIAEQDSNLIFIPSEYIDTLLRKYPELMYYFFHQYHSRMEEFIDLVENYAFKNTEERILDFIINKSKKSHSQTLETSHEQLAKELGTSRVVVSRLLKKLEEEKRISLSRNKIILN